jgi:hypothetical protein
MSGLENMQEIINQAPHVAHLSKEIFEVFDKVLLKMNPNVIEKYETDPHKYACAISCTVMDRVNYIHIGVTNPTCVNFKVSYMAPKSDTYNDAAMEREHAMRTTFSVQGSEAGYPLQLTRFRKDSVMIVYPDFEAFTDALLAVIASNACFDPVEAQRLHLEGLEEPTAENE